MTDDDLIALMEHLGLQAGADWRLAKVDGKVEIVIGRHAMEVLAEHAPDQEAAQRARAVLAQADADALKIVLIMNDGCMSCLAVHADGTTQTRRLKFFHSLLAAQREVTGQLIDEGYYAAGKNWDNQDPQWTREFRKTP
jgi:hypothetical protein